MSATASIDEVRSPDRPRLSDRLRPAALWQGLQGWLTERKHSTIGFSILRILFAIAMLIVLVPSYADRHYLWGAGAWWVEPEASRRGWWEPLRLLFPKDNAIVFDVSFHVLLALAVLFLVGFQTRFVTPVLLVFWVGLSTNTTLLGNGGDTLMRIVLLFVVFADLSRHFSIDAWLRRRGGGIPSLASARKGRFRMPRRVPPWFGAWLHNTVLILCVFQILLVYFVSSVLKFQGEEWLNGTAIYYALSIDQFHVIPALSELAWQSAPVVALATWAALWVQMLFPVLILWKPTRYVAVLLITGMHLGIAILLGLWPFSLAMIALDLLLVRDGSWRRLAGRVDRVRRGLLSPAT
ncbi:HTTM domain-containing protein [Microbacterium sp. LMI1-1-1.1]|uniref:HTTM domain-containing protein n=1 Tax=Microbacterium sp. LMI1-1-1.1 TaxID=3135223 RepID=UPI0034654328